jgi:flagellar basal-body rod protein FlgF
VTGLIDAATAILVSSGRQVEAAAGNIANSSTGGFKRSAIFSEILLENQAQDQGLPTFQQSTDLSQGQLTLTDGPLDIAIYGPGFFQLRDGDRVVYSRGGSFHLIEGGRLADVADRVMQTAEGGDLVTSRGEIEILDDGMVLENGLPIGTLALWEASEGTAVQAIGGSLFGIDEKALTEATQSQVRQGFVEGSNVLMSDEMVAMMSAVRRAEGGGRIVQVYDQLMGQAVQTFSRSGR